MFNSFASNISKIKIISPISVKFSNSTRFNILRILTNFEKFYFKTFSQKSFINFENNKEKMDINIDSDFFEKDKDEGKERIKVKIKDKKMKKRKNKMIINKNVLKFYPNYFVAIKIENTTILDKITEIQNKILKTEIKSKEGEMIEFEKMYAKSIIKKEKLHFTLQVFQLNDKSDEEKERVKIALQNCLINLKPINLEIEGVNHFQNNVIFAQLKNADEIKNLADKLREELEKQNILLENKRPFKPHLTIAKISKDKTLIKKKIKSFPPEIWKEYKSEIFGCQNVTKIQFLSMKETNPETGYYKIISEAEFAENIC